MEHFPPYFGNVGNIGRKNLKRENRGMRNISGVSNGTIKKGHRCCIRAQKTPYGPSPVWARMHKEKRVGVETILASETQFNIFCFANLHVAYLLSTFFHRHVLV
jgi:hypothetical protein